VSQADAAPRRYYDPETHSFKTFDLDATRQQALAPAPQASTVKRYPKPDKKFDRQVVRYDTTEKPGTVIIDTKNKFLYLVQDGGMALRMGVGVGREGFGWSGVVHVGMKRENPKWFPPPEMIQRQPELAKYAGTGMDGGDGNPLGVRALYLFNDKGKDTLYRIHGTIEPYSIGQNVSSGCIRMLNENVTVLYDLVPIGAKVIVM
jgi:lipoprotein-anchoring transpeptidase ErfK/SrfK